MKLFILTVLQLYSFCPAYTLQCENECLNKGDCTVDTLSTESKCYYLFNNVKKTWDETAKLCEVQGLSMVKVSKELLGIQFTEQSLFRGFPEDEYVWLGAAAKDLSNWTFVNGVLLEEKYANGLSKSQDGQENYLCGTVTPTIDDISVERDDCRSEHHFICRFSEWEDNPSFYVSETQATWFNARSRCVDLGGNLFYLKEGDNLQFLEKKITEYASQRLFIGLTIRDWKWGDGQDILHYNWMPNEPNLYGEKCVAMHPGQGQWFDMGCSSKMHVFCQGEASVIPTPQDVKETCTTCNRDGMTAVIAVLCILIVGFLAGIAVVRYRRKNRKLQNDKTQDIQDSVKSPRSGDQMKYKAIGTQEDVPMPTTNQETTHSTWPDKPILMQDYSMVKLKMSGMNRLFANASCSPDGNAVVLNITCKHKKLEVAANVGEPNGTGYLYSTTLDKEIDPATLNLQFGNETVVLSAENKCKET